MPQYIYREFTVFYEITDQKNAHGLYNASGSVMCLINMNKKNQIVDFSTEFSTISGVKKGIKKIIEEYIDFEWEQFSKTKDAL
ncbi:hypothetical protein [Legionella maioricensis]|uniref:Uncharacterized protein n=1 Tax=Legionella maioricensis TaxID=2896528 RepID=A0A9X2IAS7_9GAMM|nr:hypothetical protein [Legionella maioricensis]MCL9683631.1 hypothetical protein [Legionella maioricensis]MCL9687653.1 hypothetical protein [Legionella maioricensis]